MNTIVRFGTLFLILATLAPRMMAQVAATPDPGVRQDSVIIFSSPRPLIETEESISDRRNSWGFSASISDFGFGAGMYYKHLLARNLSAGITLDIGGAKGPKEFASESELKVNRIYVMPLILNLQYRVLADVLSEGLRPYLTAGAGPSFVMATDAQEDFFTSFGNPVFTTTFGGYFGFGANFGLDPKANFGASLRYYIIPYDRGIESTRGRFLTDFNGVSLTVTYGFNW
jgi:outer membrane protein W